MLWRKKFDFGCERPKDIPFPQKLHSAHFFRRAASLFGAHGTMGMIATNTIAQGDTRSTGLQHLVVNEGLTIFNATTNMKWPVRGANVTVSIVHLAKGSPTKFMFEDANTLRTVPETDTNTLRIVPHLDGKAVYDINSRLRPTPRRPHSLRFDINYSAVDAFETFPFPEAPQRAPDSELERVAATLYEITVLIRQHELLDQTVLAAYGWSDIEVPPYSLPLTDFERARLQAFEDEIIDRLFALNASRAQLERLAGSSKKTKPITQTTLL